MSLDAVALARVLLQDTDITNYVWPVDVLVAFQDAAVRRLSPVCGERVVTDCTYVPDRVEYSLSALVGYTPLEVEDIVFNDYGEEIDWGVYGDTLTFASAPTENFKVKAVLPYNDLNQLSDALCDAVSLEIAGRALDFLLRRGGKALARYLVDQGEMQPQEIRGLAQYYHDEFMRYREEWGTGTARGLG
jgi:hypothetical protein